MAEQENFDRKVRDKLKDQERPLPPGLWENIDKALPPTPPVSGGASPWAWWIGSAVGVVVVSALLYFNLSSENTNSTIATSAENSSVISSDKNSSEKNSQQLNPIASSQNQEEDASVKSSSVPQGSSTTDLNSGGGSTTGLSTTNSSGATSNRNVGRITGNNSAASTTGANTSNRGTGNVNGGYITSGNATGQNANTKGVTAQTNTGGSTTNPSGRNANPTSTNNTNSNGSTSSTATTNAGGVNGPGGIAPVVSGDAPSISPGTSAGNSASPNSTNGNVNTSLQVVGTTTSSPASDSSALTNRMSSTDIINNANTTGPNANPIEIDSTKVNTDDVPVVLPIVNTAVVANAGSNTTTNTTTTGATNTDAVNQNSNDIDSTHSISNPAYPEVIAGNSAVVHQIDQTVIDSSKTQLGIIAAADSTVAVADTIVLANKEKEKEKQKQKQKNENLHAFSAEVYMGAGYGAYALRLNPNAVYTDSTQGSYVSSRFEEGTKTNTISFSFGGRVNYKLSNQFELHAGIRYQQYSQTYSTAAKRLDSIYYVSADSFHVNPLYHFTYFPYSGKEKTTFISIPIGLTYKYMISDNISVYGRGAFDFRFVSSTGWSAKDIDGNVYASGKPSRSFNVGAYLAAGIQYKLNERLFLFAEPNTSFTIQNLYGKNDLVKQKPASFGLAVGLRMEF